MMSLSVVNGLNMIISTYFGSSNDRDLDAVGGADLLCSDRGDRHHPPLNKRFTKQQLIRFAVIVAL